MRQVSERYARARRPALAWRARAARVRERLRAGVEDVGRTPEDDPQRVPLDALAEGSTGADCAADAGLLLRRERRAAAGVRSAAGQVAATGSPEAPARR